MKPSQRRKIAESVLRVSAMAAFLFIKDPNLLAWTLYIILFLQLSMKESLKDPEVITRTTLVFVNGMLMEEGRDYDEVNGEPKFRVEPPIGSDVRTMTIRLDKA